MSRILVDEVRSHSGAGIVIPADPVDFGDKVTIMDGKSVSGDSNELFGTFTVGPATTTLSGNPIFQHRTFVSNYGILVSEAWDNDSGFATPGIQGQSAGGTFDSPTYPKSSQYLAIFAGAGYFPVSPPFTSQWRLGGNLVWEADGDWGPANRAGRLSCYVGPVEPSAISLRTAWRTTATAFKLFPDGDLTVDNDTLNSVGIFKIGPIVHTFGAESFQSLFSYDNYGEVEVFAYGSSGLPNPGYNSNIASGTFASPLYPLTNSIVMGLYANGWDEAQGAFFTSGSFQFVTVENWSATQRGTNLTLALAPAGSTSLVHVFEATGSLFSIVVPLKTKASAASAAGIRLPHGTAPSSPVDGDVWTTTAGMFVQINGVTKTVTLT